jgi:hypothetical protein
VVIEARTETELPARKTKEVIPASSLRINRNGIFVKGEKYQNPARIYEDMCAKLARLAHPGKFIISSPIVDRMAMAKGSILHGSRPDALILEEILDPSNEFYGLTLLTGMQEYKSGQKSNGKYDLPQKAAGCQRIAQDIDDNPDAIARDLREVIGDSFTKIPIDLSMVVAARTVEVTFVTNSPAEEVSERAYPRLKLHYDVVESPRAYRPPDLGRLLVSIPVVVFNS